LRFRLNWSDGRGLRRPCVAGVGLIALALALAVASPAQAAGPYVLEVREAIESTGFGEVACEYKVEGVLEVEQPCEALEFETKKQVKLKPAPEPGSEFVHFENGTGSASACNGLTGTCTFTIEADSYVEARFDAIAPSLAVHPAGEGEVSCMIEGWSQSCEAPEEYEFEAKVTVIPEPAEGWEFAGYRNGTGSAKPCVGLKPSEPCTFILKEDSTIEAVFEPIMYALKITKAGTGQGAVTCNGTTCSSYPDGAEVTLKATPASGSTFSGWSGEGCSGTGTCLVTIEAAPAAVTATFQASTPPPPPPPPTLEPEGTAKAGAIAKVKAGKAQVKLTCAGGPCNGTLKLTAKLLQGGKRKSLTIGRGSFSIAEGAATTLKVKLSASAVRELAKAHSLKARAGGSDVIAGPVKLKLAAGG
jgi:hypothetical protein